MTQYTSPAPAPAKRKISPLAVTIIGVVALVLLFIWFASIWTEVLWYEQLGYVNVLVTQWLARGAMFAIGFIMMAVPLFLAIDISYRTRPVYAKLSSQLDRYQEVIEPLRRLLTWGVPVVFGVFAGLAASAWWQPVLMWWHSAPTGVEDPQFGHDISFYLFDLNLWQGIVAFASAVTLIALIATAATSYLYGGIVFTGKEVRISKSTRIQAGILATLYVALQGVSLWLDQFLTMNETGGIRTGAMYTDVHAVIPAKQILAGIAIIVALLFLVAAITGKWRMPVVGTALLLVASLVVGAGYPWTVQQFKVTPDEKILEEEYVQRNIDATRAAFGLDNVEVERYDAVTDAEPGALRNDAETTANIRIMDPEIISSTFAQLEQIRQYYKFPSKLTVDRYEIDGKIEDTVAAVRDIDISNQSGWVNRTLVYTHGYGLVAAYGNQRSVDGQPVFLEAGIPSQGRLGEFEPRVYFGVNSPPYSIVGGDRESDIEIDYPSDDRAVVPVPVPDVEEDSANVDDAVETEPDAADDETATTEDPPADDAAEGDVADTDEPVVADDTGPQNMTTFDGDGGPVLKGMFERILYALKFQDIEILLSGSVAPNSQILFDRNPVDRVQKVAPYLTIDSTPYPSVVDGKIVWIIDGYTTSSSYPYSEMVNFNQAIVDADHPTSNPMAPTGINYIRNSVKATVDAHDGSVTLYAWDDEDPLLQSWSKIFPSTVKPVSEMSGDLMSHVRYPSDMFKVQRQILGEYHVTESGAFYSAEDAWRTPNNPVNTGAAGPNSTSLPQPPYYLTLAAGKNEDPEFSIYSTYIPDQQGEGSRDILTGYLAANSNAGNVAGEISEGYGTLKLLTLPKGDTVPGPGQVQNSFTTDPNVTSLLNMLRLGESQVISGNLLTLPVGGGLLYVQPVFVRASSGTSYPLLQKVLVSFGDKIAFEDTLDAALDDLFGGDSGANAGDNQLTDEDGNPIDSEELPDDSGDDSNGETPDDSLPATQLDQALRNMQEAIQERDTAMQAGDWTAYGEADAKLQEALATAIDLME